MSLLQKRIIEASQKYYSEGTSDISDDAFDSMLQELKQQNPDDPLLTAVGHGYSVEADSTYGTKVRHRYGTAGSLAKCHNLSEYGAIMKCDIDVCFASLKLDGLSVVLYYKHGRLDQALTRGDGTTGIDITDKVKIIAPELISCTDSYFEGAVRGEILMSYASFDKYVQSHPEAKNPRNTAAGLVNSKELSDELKLLNIVIYNVVGISNTELTHYTYLDNLRSLSKLFDEPKVVSYASLSSIASSDDAFQLLMRKLREQWYGYYPADGIVITSYSAEIEVSPSNYYDRYIKYNACAYKFPSEVKATTVKEVVWELSKTKYLIPRVNFDTIELAGTSVSFAHGDNAQSIKDRGIGPGAVVNVTKAGEIIPHITEVIEPAEVILPECCPCCNSKLVWKGMHLACPNAQCSDASMQDLLVWTNKISPYLGLGDQLKIKFFNQMFSDTIPSIEEVYEHGRLYAVNKSVQYTNFVHMYNGLFDNEVALSTAIEALNIPRLSEVNATKLAQLPDLVEVLMNGEVPNLSENEIKLIGGYANYESIKENLDKFARLRLIRTQIDFSIPENIEVRGKVAITGKLSMKRADFENLLLSHGYKAVSSLSKDTLCLITDDPSSGSSKNKQADKLGIEKITESEFVTRYLN